MKLLITSPTVAPSLDGAQHLGLNTLVDLDAASAHGIVAAGRGLYLDAKDDPTTRGNAPGRNTASEAQVSAVRDALKAAGKAGDKAADKGTKPEA